MRNQSSSIRRAQHTLEVAQRSQDVLDLFADAVAHAPTAIAVSAAVRDTSYGELDRRSNQVAHALVEGGAAPGSVVALVLEDAVEQIVATLGCLKAGCVFATIDASAPEPRIRRMLAILDARWAVIDSGDSSAVALLTQALGGRGGLLWMDGPADDGAGAMPGNDCVRVRDQADQPVRRTRLPDDPCYVYFTSGSTGWPKAILGRTRGLAHFIQWEIASFGLGLGARVSQLTNPSFDVYLRDIFSPLCAGGTVCIPPPGLGRYPAALRDWVGRARSTLMHCVPSLFRLLLQAGIDAHCFPELRFVLLAGESLPPADANRWTACFGERARLVNLYGPTETTLAKFCYRLPAEPVTTPFVPIGRPIPGAEALLLDAEGQPCGAGEIGELFIRTPYRSLGYYGNEEATAAAFIAHPLTGQRDDIVYRTGDLARRLPDGNFQFCGRRDNQVKIRGVRVELGDVEAALRLCLRLSEAAVMAREDAHGELRLVAYVVGQAAARGDVPSLVGELRRTLAQHLPDAMLPDAYVVLDRLPLSPNGKLDRSALPAPGSERPELMVAYVPPRDAGERRWCELFAEVLGLDCVGRDDNFFDLGGNSLLAARVLAMLQAEGTALSATTLFAQPTPAGLAALSTGGAGDAVPVNRMPRGQRSDARRDARRPDDPIAIIAMAGRFPGADDVEQFWSNLCDGVESITRFQPDQIDPSIARTVSLDPHYVPARGVIDGVENFDAAFFGISPGEAELMDPQHRIFLELCWECMERAGQVPDAALVPVGVFAGTYHSTYLKNHVSAYPDRIDRVGLYQVTLANEKDYIATRVAHKLNLTGPAISLYTACSTSLVAVCQAVDSLRLGRCDMALAGGIAITCPPQRGHLYQEGAMFSPDGSTRTFDAQANGTVFSDGGAVVLLKRLSDAIRDGNPVHALIRGAAVNNDGADKASFTAPSSDAQAAVIAMAQIDAGVGARSIGYVETHGTATPVGDPIEIEGLSKAFRRETSDVGFCRIGSVKSNIGHLVIAAGGAGLIKTALALSQRKIPASLHFEHANPVINFANSPFVVNGSLSEWDDDVAPRRAGVSSFGVGGTNAHVVLEQAPPVPASEVSEQPQLLVLSARTPGALAAAAARLAGCLDDAAGAGASAQVFSAAAAAMDDTHPAANLADVAWTLAVGRKAFAYRAALVAKDGADAIAQLRGAPLAQDITRSKPARPEQAVFLFPGQGSHYVGMGRQLREQEPEFRAAFDACAKILKDAVGIDLQLLMTSDDPAALLPTALMQPAIFSVEYALARLWMARGVQPAAMIGHSVGEFVAATIAGVFSLDDALRLVAQRGALMQAQPTGAMLSVRMPAQDVLPRLPHEVCLAAENAAGSCVVSGPSDAVARLRAALEAEDIGCRPLQTSHAFHSPMMEPVVEPFRALVAQVPRSAPTLPIVSTATGAWLDAETATSADYWAQHLRVPVRFAQALGVVLDAPGRLLLEVGPRSTLCSLARQHPLAREHNAMAVASLGDSAEDEGARLRAATGQLWCLGVPVNPAVFDQRARRCRVRLPTYPFERRRFWVEAGAVAAPLVVGGAAVTRPAASAFAQEIDSAVVPLPLTAGAQVDGDLLAPLLALLNGVTGFDLSAADSGRTFFELGFDSLMLTQVVLQVQKRFAATVTYRQFMAECATIDGLIAVLAAQSKPAPVAAPTALARKGLRPPVAGARLGRDPDGAPAWFVRDPGRPGKFVRLPGYLNPSVLTLLQAAALPIF